MKIRKNALRAIAVILALSIAGPILAAENDDKALELFKSAQQIYAQRPDPEKQKEGMPLLSNVNWLVAAVWK